VAGVFAAGLVVSVGGTAAAVDPAPSRPAASSYSAPLAGSLVVLRPFTAPPTPYAAGNRGVDLTAAAGAVVLAAGSGTVTFAGSVAGRGVVVLAHADGIRTEYEPLSSQLIVGQSVARGDPIGQVSGRRAGCGVVSCLHWGARRGDVYFDPMSLLNALGPVRLIAW
jgi:murein DD-endopeptidase MepM/ murein hydrolase activator NlpD